jgi:hypothetical protein
MKKEGMTFAVITLLCFGLVWPQIGNMTLQPMKSNHHLRELVPVETMFFALADGKGKMESPINLILITAQPRFIPVPHPLFLSFRFTVSIC